MFLSIISLFISIMVASPINKTLSTTQALSKSLNHTGISPIKREDFSAVVVGDMCTYPTFGSSIHQGNPDWCLFASLTTYPYKGGNQNKYDIHVFYLFRNNCELIGYVTGVSQDDGQRYPFDSELPMVVDVETSQSAAGGIHPHIFYGSGGNNLPECWIPVNGIVPNQLAS
ncbi:hypothetical protein BDZ45DRAFT_692069 [Acephala macrosclerotiorum]|nr:hypothetical protein BDZ45DRAFT_692069 [Acephala macrosclerotiorum]